MAETTLAVQSILDKLEFYYRNFIDCELDGFTFAGDFSDEENVADRDGDTVALTSGFNDDDLAAKFDVIFGQSRTVDTIFLESNAKNLRIRYSHEAAGEDVAQVVEITGTTATNDIVMVRFGILSIDQFVDINSCNPAALAAYYEGLLGRINADSVPVTATYINSGNHAAGIRLTSDVAGTAFLYECNSYGNGTIDDSLITANNQAWHDFTPALWYQASESFLKMEVAAVSARRVRVSITGTQTADAEKQINQLIITKKITTMALPEGAEIISKAKGTSIENIEGGTVIVFDFPTMQKMEINMAMKNWTGANYTAYALLKQRRLIDSYLVYAFLSETISHLGIDALYLMSDISDDVNTPSASNFEAGVDGEINLREA